MNEWIVNGWETTNNQFMNRWRGGCMDGRMNELMDGWSRDKLF